MILLTLLTTIGKATHQNADDEIELMKRIQARDDDALEELYDLYKCLLLGVILSIVKKREEAEDILQEIFVKIWEKADSFDQERGNVYSWIVRLARNKAIDHIRSKQKKQSASTPKPFFSLEDDTYDPMETTMFSDRTELVKKALDEIPEKQHEVIKIAYYRGLTQSQIAGHLGIPLGTVKTRTRQGMMELKRILREFISPHG